MSLIARMSGLLLLLALPLGAAAQSTCSHLLLVSGYFSNVHIYDACNGTFLRTLDADGQIRGAQAVRLRNGELYVIAEVTNAVLRYRADTFAKVDTFIASPGGGITGLDFAPNGEIYIGQYNIDAVRRYTSAGVLIGDAIASRAGGLNGPDNGLVFGPDGRLYVPAYDGDNVVRYDPQTGTLEGTFIPARSNGLNETRGILFRPGGQTFLVTGEGSGQVLEFRTSDGAFVRQLISGLFRPTGMVFHPDGSLLVIDNGGVFKFDPDTGARRSQLVTANSGGLDGPTFLALIPNPANATVDQSQLSTQFWVAGSAPIVNKRIEVTQAVTGTGAHFGAAFATGEVVTKRWGTVRIEFTSCTTANLTWDSTGANSGGFGSGGYPLQRFFSNEISARCLADGFAQPSDPNWFVGAWWGGASRSGEGLLLDRTGDGIAFLTWFTYRAQ